MNKYPSHRDDTVKGYWKWLEGRREDDNAEGLWRVHDKIYDLRDWADKHPGGRDWIEVTKVSYLKSIFFHSKVIKKCAIIGNGCDRGF
jgi:hypothetical protein